METEVPLLIKAVAYIESTEKKEKDTKKEFVEELVKSNSSITLMFVYSKLVEHADEYCENTKYQNIMNLLSEQIQEVEGKYVMVFDENKRRFKKRPLKK